MLPRAKNFADLGQFMYTFFVMSISICFSNVYYEVGTNLQI